MPLQVPQQSTLLPAPLPSDLYLLLSPVENIVHGYNIAEQTCFHKTTVSNVIPAFRGLSGFLRAIDALLQPVRGLISAASSLIADVTSAVGLARTLLSTATTAVGTVITLVTTLIGVVTGIVATLSGIATACLVAGIATIAAGVLFGFGFVGVGGIALTVLLTIFFFVVRGAVMGIATLLGTVTGALTPLTAALAPLNTAIGAVNGILANPALPSDVTRSLAAVSAALTDLQNALAPAQPGVAGFAATLASTTQTLDDRTKTLRDFLNPTTAKVPRTSLEDTRIDAIAIYNAGLTAAAATNPVMSAVRTNPINRRQIIVNGADDTTLACPKEIAGD